MNKIEQRIGGEWKETRHGSTDRDEAIQQMFQLCAEYVSVIQKQGKRVQIDSGNWDNRLVFRVCSQKNVIVAYSIKK